MGRCSGLVSFDIRCLTLFCHVSWTVASVAFDGPPAPTATPAVATTATGSTASRRWIAVRVRTVSLDVARFLTLKTRACLLDLFDRHGHFCIGAGRYRRLAGRATPVVGVSRFHLERVKSRNHAHQRLSI